MRSDKPLTLLPLDDTAERSRICREILTGLPEWFAIREAIDGYADAVASMPMFVAWSSDRPAGFIAVAKHNQWSAEIHVMAVVAGLHRCGVGRALVAHAEEFLLETGVEYLMLRTLSDRHPSPEYARTREFYFALGFRPLVEDRAIWGDENPCVILVKRLR